MNFQLRDVCVGMTGGSPGGLNPPALATDTDRMGLVTGTLRLFGSVLSYCSVSGATCGHSLARRATDGADFRGRQRDATWGDGLESESQRLARLARMCSSGQVAAAELELYGWRRAGGFPTAGAVLLAALLGRRGMTQQAIDVLTRHGRDRQAVDASSAKLMVALLIEADLLSAARVVARDLFDHAGHDPHIARWLEVMKLAVSSGAQSVPACVVDQLTLELRSCPGAIPSLVAAQKLSRVAHDVALLRGAVERLLREVSDPAETLPMCTALAELALLAGDRDDARRWAHRGLKIEPYSATLALVLAQVEDDQELGRPARTVLADVALRYPRYPDVQAALIRREHADGKGLSARRRLAAWLQREPAQPLARELERELAA